MKQIFTNGQILATVDDPINHFVLDQFYGNYPFVFVNKEITMPLSNLFQGKYINVFNQ